MCSVSNGLLSKCEDLRTQIKLQAQWRVLHPWAEEAEPGIFLELDCGQPDFGLQFQKIGVHHGVRGVSSEWPKQKLRDHIFN